MKILKYKKLILVLLAVVTSLFGIIGFYLVGSTPLQIITHTLGLFILEWVDYPDCWILDLAKLFGILTTSLGLLLMFFSKYFYKWQLQTIQRSPYNIIIGLSEQNISLLKNSDPKVPTIIIEKDTKHRHLDYFKEKGFATIEGHTKKAVENLDLTYMQHCVISTDNDRKNIALGKLFINRVEGKQQQNIYVAIGNKDLNVLFKQDIIGNQKKSQITVSSYSLYENMEIGRA
ncbi:MAG TPA: hypothetical protein ENK99_00825, partial [Campylobacterales bacterium]|nr:hypothetical protein [Campylobacterales bacterium]